MSQPIHIVMTPTRNEAWVLRAFLEATSHWADYIIIADQMSTDGTREIVQAYADRKPFGCEIILIDNTNPEFNEAERQTMLVAKAREVAAGRDTLLWGLDADEIFTANFRKTDDWKKIISSKPGSVFGFLWAEVTPDLKNYRHHWDYHYPWCFHDDGKEPHGNYVRNMHSMRIPYPKDERLLFDVDDFRGFHLAYLNQYRVASKRRFYQFVDWEMNKRDPITLFRSYTQLFDKNILPIPQEYFYTKENDGFDLFSLVDTKCKRCYMDEYIVERLNRHSMKELRKLDIWGKAFTETYNLQDPRRWIDRLIHFYLRKTATLKNKLVIRAIDKVLKKIY